MTSPLSYAPTANHNLDTTEYQWKPNALSIIAEAVVSAAKGSHDSTHASYYPTLWTRAQETCDLLAKLQRIDISAMQTPELNEWLAILWGLCTGQIETAVLNNDSGKAGVCTSTGEVMSLQRELHYVLGATRPRGMEQEPILLFYYRIGKDLIWVGGYDPRCLVFSANMERKQWVKLLPEQRAVDKNGTLRLHLDLDHIAKHSLPECLGFLRYLDALINADGIGKVAQLLLGTVGETIKQMCHAHAAAIEIPAVGVGPLTSELLRHSKLAQKLLQRFVIPIDLPRLKFHPDKKLRLAGKANGIWIKNYQGRTRLIGKLSYQPPDAAEGKRIYDEANNEIQFDWIDPVQAFVADYAIGFDQEQAVPDYLPLKPQVLEYYSYPSTHLTQSIPAWIES